MRVSDQILHTHKSDQILHKIKPFQKLQISNFRSADTALKSGSIFDLKATQNCLFDPIRLSDLHRQKRGSAFGRLCVVAKAPDRSPRPPTPCSPVQSLLWLFFLFVAFHLENRFTPNFPSFSKTTTTMVCICRSMLFVINSLNHYCLKLSNYNTSHERMVTNPLLCVN